MLTADERTAVGGFLANPEARAAARPAVTTFCRTKPDIDLRGAPVKPGAAESQTIVSSRLSRRASPERRSKAAPEVGFRLPEY